MNLFSIRNLFFSYSDKRPVLDIKELDLKRDGIIIFSGPNGSGKTTLFKILSGFIKNYSGEIRTDLRFSQISFLPQEPCLLKRSVRKNLEYGLKLRKIFNTDERIDQALEMTGLLKNKYLKRKWFELSGGEKKRVALAQRLVLRPLLMILDEPSESVDSETKYYLSEAVKQASSEWKTSFIISTHDKIWGTQTGNSFYSMVNGKVFPGGFLNFIKSEISDKFFILMPERIKISENEALENTSSGTVLKGFVTSCLLVSGREYFYSVDSGLERVWVKSSRIIKAGSEVTVSYDKNDLEKI
jgi:tungstate transport system ATP-binding protein